MTEQELRDIEAQANNASAGPWFSGPLLPDEAGDYVVWRKTKAHGRQYIANIGQMTEPVLDATEDNMLLFDVERKDAEFVAAARTNVPRLVAEVRRLEAENIELRIERADLSTGHTEAHAEVDRLRVALVHIATFLSTPTENWCAAEYARRILLEA